MMTPFKRLHLVRTLYRSSQIGESSSYLLGCCKSYSSALSNGSEGNFRSFHPHLLKGHDGFPFAGVKSLTLRSTMAAELSIFMNNRRISTQVKASAQARQVGQQISISSPGFIYESYEPREKIPFWKRWFTRSGWRRTKNDIILELKSAYAIAKLRKKGYSKNQFYNEAANMYKEINTLIAKGDKRTLRKAVTENMFSIGVDRKDLNKTFIQLTLEILAKQKFEAYDSKGSVVAGDKSKEVLVRDIWVLEKSMFHPGATWRLCGRISPKASQLFP
ncbi:uncharacterized protein LOC114369135 [Glycine soja]|uniref:Large ribosomal subunit protein mL45 n=1 Tax=Glycine soja TaxID=3848 RepID=A0A445IN13_GLYSO|nr:uncharacterized protein LOC114369135 [Glycine soja]RZB87459.1 hypothetical protein D0Y65_027193 [Glycine soja]